MVDLMLVEDDVATREWLVGLIASIPDVKVGLACGTVTEAREWLDTHAPDIVLTDLGLPDGSGLDVIRIAARRPGCEILVLSIFGDEANVLAAIDAGAGGYLLKDGSIHDIHEHLACLRSGGSPLSPRIARTLVRRVRRTLPDLESDAQESNLPGVLSQRELDVLIGIGKGFSYAEVAVNLGISTNTVRTHVRHIYGKLCVNSGAEALYEYNRLLAEQGQPHLR